MLPRRFHLRPGSPLETPDTSPDLFKQASIALVAVLMLALTLAFATEALSLITPPDAIAFVP